ncbi:MAG: GIY-YIG nuclease family protein [Patescibacteria group bacterium]
MFYTYIIQSEMNGELYTGFTSDLKQRLLEHNRGLNFSTKRYMPWKLIYYEACLEESDAKRREKYLKTTQGGRLIKSRIKDYLYNRKINQNSTTG